MLACIDDLQRSTDRNDTFADDVMALAEGIEAGRDDSDARGAMIDMVRRHRVAAIKARAKMVAIGEPFVRRFGIERFERERSKRSARPHRLN